MINVMVCLMSVVWTRGFRVKHITHVFIPKRKEQRAIGSKPRLAVYIQVAALPVISSRHGY